jgi:hypothetical protein
MTSRALILRYKLFIQAHLTFKIDSIIDLFIVKIFWNNISPNILVYVVFTGCWDFLINIAMLSLLTILHFYENQC